MRDREERSLGVLPKGFLAKGAVNGKEVWMGHQKW